MTVSNANDVNDSRDIIERLAELECEKEDIEHRLKVCEESGDEEGTVAARNELEMWREENGEEYKELDKVNSFGWDYAPDWRYGETLIRDSYFIEYVKSLVDDLGALDLSSLPDWIRPHVTVDWDSISQTILQDYSPVEWDGVTYWIRSV